MQRLGGRAALAVHAIALAACTGQTAPTQVPPPITNPPAITCPAATMAQSPDGNPTPVTFTPTVVNGQPPLTTSCAPASGSAFAVGQKMVTCTVTDALQRSDACGFVVSVTGPPTLSATSFLAFGDSITWGEDGQNSTSSSMAIMSARIHPAVQLPYAEQYPTVLQQSLATRYPTQSPTVSNAGKPGEAAGDPATLFRFVGLVSSRQYAVALIMEGSNDIFYADPTQEPAAIAGLRSMIRSAKGLSIRPYLATIPPENPTACVPVCRGQGYALVPGFNDSVRTLAMTEGVTLVDVNQAFNGNLALIGPDGLHPNAAGYATIAGAFFQAVTSTLELPSSSRLSAPRRTTLVPRR